MTCLWGTVAQIAGQWSGTEEDPLKSIGELENAWTKANFFYRHGVENQIDAISLINILETL